MAKSLMLSEIKDLYIRENYVSTETSGQATPKLEVEEVDTSYFKFVLSVQGS